MKQKLSLFLLLALSVCALFGCVPNGADTTDTPDRETLKSYYFGFESIDEFKNCYITPQGYLNSAYHEQSTEIVFAGNYSHKAYITGSNPDSTIFTNNNHRAYPTMQFFKMAQGSLTSPVMITMKVFLDAELRASLTENEWFSFATLTGDDSENWLPVVCVNLSYDGFVHLMHVPSQGKKEWLYQTDSLKFPMREWVELKIYYDNRENGFVKVWQNGTLVSHALIKSGNGVLSQAHFGLYAAPSVTDCSVYNDDITIEEHS